MSEREAFRALIGRCESPIEVQLASCLATLLFDSADQVSIVPQYRLGKYRFDFAIRHVPDAAPLLLIECDGKEFHSKPEDVENDHRKDKIARDNGLEVLRFPGDQIYLYPMRCAQAVIACTARALLRHWRSAA